MDGYSRTCIEWMCNDEYEPGAFDLKNIMSPPDHESMFVSLINANPLAEEDPACSPAATSAGPLSGAASRWRSPAADTLASSALQPEPSGPSLVALVQQLDLMKEPATAAAATQPPQQPPGADASALVAAVGQALGTAQRPRGLSRVCSSSRMLELDEEEAAPPVGYTRERRMSVSCPNTPPAARRAQHSFFTESVFDRERPAAISRVWQQQQQQGETPAAAASDTLDTHRAKARVRPKPSRLRELNFMAPTSM